MGTLLPIKLQFESAEEGWHRTKLCMG